MIALSDLSESWQHWSPLGLSHVVERQGTDRWADWRDFGGNCREEQQPEGTVIVIMIKTEELRFNTYRFL